LPASDYTETGVPVIRGGNLSLSGTRFTDDGFVFVHEQTAERLSRSLCRPCDLIFTKKGTIGQTGIIPKSARFDKYLLSSNQLRLSVDPAKADPLFVYYYLSSGSSRTKIIQDSSVTGVPKTNLAYFRQFPILLPPLIEQQGIADVLGALDDKIELNRKMNETLEAMARATFQSWFVDFDPVHAKARGEEPAGLSAEIAALFPSEFEDSELGPIPKGWSATRLEEEFNVTMGQSPPGESYNESGDGMPLFQGKTDFGFRFPSPRVYCTEPTRFAAPGDTLVSVRAPVGSVNMASERCCIGRGVASVRHKLGGVSYTYCAMKFLGPQFATFEAEGTVFGSINKRDFNSLKIVRPSAECVQAFDQIAEPLDERIRTSEIQIDTLTALRDLLLPKLLSGEVRINWI
jgi:type I restriction enzyme S subunit